jgi:hypothetical protein
MANSNFSDETTTDQYSTTYGYYYYSYSDRPWYYPSWNTLAFQVWKRFMATLAGSLSAYICVIMLPIGVVGNVIVLAFMPVTKKVSVKMRMYFITIAAANLFSLIVSYGLGYFPSYGIYFWTGGAINWVFIRVIPCWAWVVYNVTSSMSTALASYTILAIAAQRAFVVVLPLSSHRLTIRVSYCLLLACFVWAGILATCGTAPFVSYYCTGGSSKFYDDTDLLYRISYIIVPHMLLHGGSNSVVESFAHHAPHSP